jgi:hypothetical protein
MLGASGLLVRSVGREAAAVSSLNNDQEICVITTTVSQSESKVLTR